MAASSLRIYLKLKLSENPCYICLQIVGKGRMEKESHDLFDVMSNVI